MSQIVIEEANLQHNIEVIKEKIKNKADDKGTPVKIIAVLKGNAYGMGTEIVAKKLLDNNIDFFAVTEVQEAVELRNQGFQNDILILNSTCIKEEVETIVEQNLIATIGSLEAIQILNKVATEKQKTINCHLKIDTGFCRFGFSASEIIKNNEFLETLKHTIEAATNLKITGTYSHFQESYANDEKTTREQFNKFLDAIAKLKSQKIETGMLHICNSSAFFKYSDMYLNAVRIGSAFSGRLQISNPTGLKRVGYLESKVCEIKELKKGDKIGYSGTCMLKKDTKIAIVEAGYAEGIGVSGPKDSVRLIDKLRAIKRELLTLFKDGTRYVTINEKKYPILGRVGLKNFMIDITKSDVQIGDAVRIEINIMLTNQKVKRIAR